MGTPLLLVISGTVLVLWCTLAVLVALLVGRASTMADEAERWRDEHFADRPEVEPTDTANGRPV